MSTLVVPADAFDAVRMQIRDLMTDANVPSVTVAVARNGNIIWEEGFGFADVANRIPATVHTAYSLASVSKPVTATALMIQVERGAIALEKPLNDYLGEQKLSSNLGGAMPTVRQVVHHTSGLPLHYQFFYADEATPLPTMDESIRRYGTLVSIPGEAFAYSNFGYGLLEYIIERTSGKSYAQFLDEELFAPLGLADSSVNGNTKRTHVALRYRNGAVVPFYDFVHRGAGAVFMSARDLARFGMFHLGHFKGLGKPILKQSTLAEMVDEAAAVPRGDGKGRYGIGWGLKEQHGLRSFGHGGGMAGVSTNLSIYPDADLVIAVLCNSDGKRIGDVENAIVHAVLPETIRHDHAFQPDIDMVGRWRGALHTFSGQVAVELDFRENGSVFAKVGENRAEEVIDVKVDPATSALYLGGITGDVGTSDAARYPYRLHFTLRRTLGTMNGSVSAVSRPLSARLGSALSYWVELKKALDHKK